MPRVARRSVPRAGKIRAAGLAGILAAAAALQGCGVQGCGVRGNGLSAVLIVVDTLRADHLGVYGYDRPTSPEIDRWAAEGALFERALAPSPWTLPSFGSLYTGHIPSRHTAGVVAPDAEGKKAFVRLDPSVRTLAEILAGAGYATAAVATNPFLHPNFGISRGFETYDYIPGNNREIRRANATIDRALEWLDRERAGPFLLLVHLFDPHMNYDPPPPVRGTFEDGYKGPLRVPVSDLERIRSGELALEEPDRHFVVSAYDEEILFVDGQVGRLLEGLRARALLESSVVFLVSDHGEEFWEHGGFEHGHAMFQELLHVPMIVWGPGVEPRRIAEPASLVDVLPTLLDALGLPPEDGIAGQSLWGALARGEPLPERAFTIEGNLYGPERKALIRWPYKAIVNVATRQRKLYHLGDDPGETRNLAEEEPAALNRLLLELQEQLRAASRDHLRHHAAELDAATREQLRALGYLD
jgi:arylsulfatase A-like enzyme